MNHGIWILSPFERLLCSQRNFSEDKFIDINMERSCDDKAENVPEKVSLAKKKTKKKPSY